MTHIVNAPILTLSEASRHLLIPKATLHAWVSPADQADALVHRVDPMKRGWPTIPFVGVVEAHVLRMLRQELHLSMRKVREAALTVRREFDTPYALATKKIATDGVDIFVQFADGDLARASDRQMPIRALIDEHLRFIKWGDDQWPQAITLQQFSDIAPVIIDPRFAWGRPVVESTRTPVAAIVNMWRAGDSMDLIAEEFDLTRVQVEAVCRAAA